MKFPAPRIAPRTRLVLSLLTMVALSAAAGCSRSNAVPSAPKLSTTASRLVPSARPTAADPGAIAHARDAKDRAWSRLKHEPGVFGMGISWDENGAVFIGVSVDKNHAAPVASIPREIEGIPVRVFQKARPNLFAKPPPPPPIYMGTPAQPSSVPCGVIDFGTLGCVVRSGNTKYFLSCAHVFAPGGNAGETVVDPPPRLPNCTTTVVGTVTAVAPVFPGGSFTIDAAIAKVASKLNYTTAMFSGYTPTTTVTDAVVGLAVKKTGAATGLRFGTVTMIHYDWTTDVSGASWDYLDQIKIETIDFARSGDSGALVVTEPENNPVAMVVGGDGSSSHAYAIATPIQRVLDRFGVTMAP